MRYEFSIQPETFEFDAELDASEAAASKRGSQAVATTSCQPQAVKIDCPADGTPPTEVLDNFEFDNTTLSPNPSHPTDRRLRTPDRRRRQLRPRSLRSSGRGFEKSESVRAPQQRLRRPQQQLARIFAAIAGRPSAAEIDRAPLRGKGLLQLSTA
jgi:hypothetical protein